VVQKKTAIFGIGPPVRLIIFTLVLVIFDAGKLPITICLSNQNRNCERQVFLME